MMYIISPPGIQYERETPDQMRERDRLTAEHNAKVRAQYEDWKRQRETPMPSMREWAKKRGLI